MASVECSNIDVNKLPENIRNELNQLELELSEGDITVKGFDKKKTKLLTPFFNSPQYLLISNLYQSLSLFLSLKWIFIKQKRRRRRFFDSTRRETTTKTNN